MSIKTNIKIQTEDGRNLDYTTPEELDITLNRKADDNNQPDSRFGEFSYSFSLPKTRNNNKIFNYANTFNSQRKFKVNPINVNVFNNDTLVLSGLLELESIKRDSYDCRFYSKLTELVDALEDVNLRDIDTMPMIDDFQYEQTIRDHINAEYKDSDETSYQFPLIFYNTFFTPYGVYDNMTDLEGYDFPDSGDRPQQNFYYILNRTPTLDDNEFYFHQFPVCFYLKSVLEGLLEYAGWSLSGSFWDTPEAKKIIMTYAGENDVYDSSTLWKNTSTGEYIAPTGDTLTPPSGYVVAINTNEFLPDMEALDFLKSIINMFNMYFFIDINNRIISMENYDTVFGHNVAPYDLNNKIDYDTISISTVESDNFSIVFEEPENKNHLGDNYFFGKNDNNALNLENYKKTSNAFYDGVYNNKVDSDNEIEIKFAAPKIKRMHIRNVENYDASILNRGYKTLFIPDMSEQTRYDNGNNSFNGGTGETVVYNEEDTIKFKGKPMLMYYYGISNSDFEQTSGDGNSGDYFYLNMDGVKQKIGIASPFAYKAYRDVINTQLEKGSSGSTASMYGSYLQTIYLMMGSSYSNPPRYSLTFGESYSMVDTLFTRFYQNRINRYKNSEVIEGTIRINDTDWKEMTLNQPLLYNGEIYSLMSIDNYSIVTGSANIKMIKHL